MPPTADVDVVLSTSPEAPTLARRCLAEVAIALPARVAEAAELLLSEVVTNAVRHANAVEADVIRLRAEAARDRLRVEVFDAGPGFDPARAPATAPPPEQPGGRGLYLVRLLADRWGTYRAGQAHCVWFELDRA